MLEGYAITNIFFTVIKSIFFQVVSDENCYYGHFPNFLYSDRLVPLFNRFHQNVVNACL